MRWHWLSRFKVCSRSARRWNFGVERLEARCVLSGSNCSAALVHAGNDLDHGIDASGNEYHALTVLPGDVAAETATEGTIEAAAPFDLAQTFLLHSAAGANHTIYLDFDGHVTSGTSWNSSFTGGAAIDTPAYDFDGNTASFSTLELERIQYIWQRVAEDFIPFNVNVTTQDPGIEALRKFGTGDAQWGVRVVIGGDGAWYGSAGGVAYVGSFNWNSDTPTFVFEANLGNGHEKYTAEAISHEAGHTLGLSHDGTATLGYYEGHGAGETGWAPIMGVGYYKNLVQWSKGQYAGANQTQDDLAIITSNNGFGYRADDVGSAIATASLVAVSGTSISGSGSIERNTDLDVYSFLTGSGAISLSLTPFTRGPNLDIEASLFDAAGTLVATANPADLLAASLSTTVSAGQYFLQVNGVGKGDPLLTGYSDYGSLGRYSFTGTIVDPGTLPTVSIQDATGSEGGSALSFRVVLSAAATETTTVGFTTANGSALSGSDYVATSGTLTFLAGQQEQFITVNLLDDGVSEPTETFVVNLGSPSGNVLISDGQGQGTITDNDVTLSINDVSLNEGNTSKKTGAPVLTTMTFTISLSGTSSDPVTVNYATADGAATVANNDYQAKSGSVTFAAGQLTKMVTVTIVGDKTVESDEAFFVQLSGATGASISDGQGTGTIRNDDSTGGGPRRGASIHSSNSSPAIIPTQRVTVGQERGSSAAHLISGTAATQSSAASPAERVQASPAASNDQDSSDGESDSVTAKSQTTTLVAVDDLFAQIAPLFDAL